MAIAIALPGFNGLGCPDPNFYINGSFSSSTDFLRAAKNKEHPSPRNSVNLLQNAPPNSVYLCGGFKYLLKVCVLWKKLETFGIIYAFLTINPCRPCWSTHANFWKSTCFSTRFISEMKSVITVFFCISDKSNPLSDCSKNSKKNLSIGHFGVNVFKIFCETFTSIPSVLSL